MPNLGKEIVKIKNAGLALGPGALTALWSLVEPS
jgi:hypothetical protein